MDIIQMNVKSTKTSTPAEFTILLRNKMYTYNYQTHRIQKQLLHNSPCIEYNGYEFLQYMIAELLARTNTKTTEAYTIHAFGAILKLIFLEILRHTLMCWRGYLCRFLNRELLNVLHKLMNRIRSSSSQQTPIKRRTQIGKT